MFSSKKEIAKRLLTEAILSGEFEAGEYLRQNDIAARFKLSSTPVREAFAELQIAGVLEHEAHRGFHVTSVDESRVVQIFKARKLIEIETARLAVPNVTDAALDELQELLADMERQRNQNEFLSMINTNDSFHRTLFSLSGNEFLVRAIEQLWSNSLRFAPWAIKGRRSASIKEHGEIFQAFSNRDEAALVQAYTLHLSNSEIALIDFLIQKTDKSGVSKK